MPDNDYGQFTSDEFGALSQVIAEMQDIGSALARQDIEWFKVNQSLNVYYGNLSNQLIALQKRLSGGKTYCKE